MKDFGKVNLKKFVKRDREFEKLYLKSCRERSTVWEGELKEFVESVKDFGEMNFNLKSLSKVSKILGR